jgi:predicted DNA-binding protein
MSITITLPPATEERLRAQAEATGKDIATLVVEAVETRLSLSELRLRDILAPVHEDFKKGAMTDAELDKLFTEERSAARPTNDADPTRSE